MKKVLILENLDCANCAEKIRSEVSKIDGVKDTSMNFMAKKLSYNVKEEHDEEVYNKIADIVNALEPDVNIIKESEYSHGHEEKSSKLMIARIIISLAVLLISMFVPMNGTAELILTVAAYLIIGSDIVFRAVRNIFKGQIFDENFLMSIATIGAFFVGEHPEAVAVMLFYQVGEYFQSYAVRKSRRSISDLMDIRPDYANLKRNGTVEKVSPESVSSGDIIVVRAGEKIPLDGIIVSGSSSVDTSALTGESIPRDVTENDQVLSGCINQSGLLEVKVTKPFAESTVSKILDLVENAGSKKASAENFITRFSKWYTPIVVILALLLAFVPPFFTGDPFSDWIYRGLVFLVISCPCALVVSVPLSFFGGIGGASKAGILIKGSNYLEALSKCDSIVFDKTGTLTEGSFTVTEINPIGISEDELLELAAAAESNSNHPIALSIKEKYNKNENFTNVYSKEIAGRGIKAEYNGSTVLAGNLTLMKENDIFADKPNRSGTIIHIAVNGEYRGNIIISDKIKKDSMLAVSALKNAGIDRICMLTGDNKDVAAEVSGTLGISEYYAELLPDDKVEKFEEIMSSKGKNSKIAFAGDGINDAPVLARADIGIAMGALGSDAAIEAADIVLMDDEPSKIATGKKIAVKTIRIVKQNIIFAIGIKVLVLIFGAIGAANMWWAVFADVGVTIIAILNAVRCLNIKNLIQVKK